MYRINSTIVLGKRTKGLAVVKRIIRNQAGKAVLVMAVSLVMVYALLGTGGMDLEDLLLISFGVEIPEVLTLKMFFLVVIILLQYFNAETMIYHIKNIDYLCIRYETRKKAFRAFVHILINTNINFIICFILGAVGGFGFREQQLKDINIFQIGFFCVIGLEFYYLISIVQMGLLLYLDEAKTFGIIALIAVGLSFINPAKFLKVPITGTESQLAEYAIIYSIAVFLGIFVVNCIYGKECGEI